MKKKRLTEKDKLDVLLELEKSRINREKAKLVLNKSLVLYFCFLLVGVFGFIFDYIDSLLLNLLIIMGLVILIFGTLPYIITISKEEKKIDEISNKYK
ncbi:hypothetical protein CMO89_03745 [Candidatus Woesearchaeota archaeon]|nr:hypothetical protein [Candidatus Woesearchaeota archaeon]|tara:strand:+ start:1004 stop:1297 length:294 start_codon:yes stop_codon:yes gene_type:complete